MSDVNSLGADHPGESLPRATRSHTEFMSRAVGTHQVKVALQTPFHAAAVIDFLLEDWLGDGGRIEAYVGGTVEFTGSASPSSAMVREVSRSASAFRLRATWDGTDERRGIVLQVTTQAGGRSRVRFTETGLPANRVFARLRWWTELLDSLADVLKEASDKRRRYRQAIVVVHGIGEQRPTSTLRNFVEAIFPEQKGTRRFFKPDYTSPLVGATAVTVPGRWAANRPTTDVYELYWAHLMRDTTVGQVYTWALRLLFAPSRNVTPRLRGYVYALRAVMLLALGALLGLAVAFVVGEAPRAQVTALIAGLSAAVAVVPGVIWKVAKLFGSPLQQLVVGNVLGDAARYFDTSPANVQARQDIREAGLQLINDLHDRGRYSRIIVYGHSLGSVIAYDILAHAWTRRSRTHPLVASIRTPALRLVEDLLNPRASVAQPVDVATVRERQYAAWNEFAGNGFQWLVSDLVTAGSPLTHARWLLNPDATTSFDQLVADRAMPTCPPRTWRVRSPRPDHFRESFTFVHHYQIDGDGRPRSVLVPDHGAPFALVRWTNVYFEHTGAFKGDPVGGPLRNIFGAWVEDVSLPHPGGGFLGFAHTKYVDARRSIAHIHQLRAALDLPVTPSIAFWLGRPDPDPALPGRDATL
jgi:hypothetical protein